MFNCEIIKVTIFFLICKLLIFSVLFVLVSANGCVHAYPPPLGFCAWAFGGGLA